MSATVAGALGSAAGVATWTLPLWVNQSLPLYHCMPWTLFLAVTNVVADVYLPEASGSARRMILPRLGWLM